MRWLWLCCSVLWLAACGAPMQAIAAGPGDGPGCLDVTAEACVGWLRATMILDERFLAEAMTRRHQTDVNGRPLSGGLVTVYGRVPERMEQFVILLHLRPDDTVKSVESNLLINLIDVHTAEIYDQSGLYDIVWRLIARRCSAIGKLDLYRFFENSVKPRITHRQEDLSSGISGLHRIVSHAAAVPYCSGITFGYTNLFEWRGGKNPAAAARPKQFSSIALQ